MIAMFQGQPIIGPKGPKGPRGDKGPKGEDFSNVYSTEETRIGTWIDGKPIYRRAFESRTGPKGVDTSIANISKLETLINIYAAVYSEQEKQSYILSASNNTDWAMIVFARGENIMVYCTHQYYVNSRVVGWVEYTKTTDKSHIYGAQWDGTSTTKWTRTDGAALFTDPVPYVAGSTNYSSPFDGLMPWAGMVKSERTGGTMVAIPKFWYRLIQNGKGLKIQIADEAVDGFSVSPAHMDRGDGKGERDVVYVGRYHCAMSDYKSKTGEKPKDNITRATARTEIHKLGRDIWQMDFATRFSIWLLYIVEFADWNSQKTIGKDCGNSSNTGNMGYTDSMPYHTGTTQSNRDTYGFGTQYRNIETLWSNLYDWCDGCYNNDSGLSIILNPNNFNDTTGGVCIGKPSRGFPSAFSVKNVSGTFQAFIPTAASGSETTYSCDYWDFDASMPCVCAGGYYGGGDGQGLFLISQAPPSFTAAHVGSRLQELP